MNTGAKELKSVLEELDELKLPHMAAELETLYNLDSRDTALGYHYGKCREAA